MITVIVTTRNRPDFLYRCLLAIQNQTFKDFECIVVGDHCLFARNVMTDFPQFRFINNNSIKKKNVGAIGKNIGIEYAAYNLIAYCDDDNVLLPNHLETIVNNIEGADFVITDFIECKHGYSDAWTMLNRGMYALVSPEPGYKDGLSLCHTKDVWYHAGKWKSIEEVGYNEDGNFIHRLHSVSSKVKIVKTTTAIYNQSEKYFTEYDNRLFRLYKTGNSVVYPSLIPLWKSRI